MRAQGYKTGWERLKAGYEHDMIITAHIEEIILLQLVKGKSYERVSEFYETLCKNFDALETMGEISILKGLVASTLNKLPNVKPDMVRMDDSWEDWDMKQLMLAIQVWLYYSLWALIL